MNLTARRLEFLRALSTISSENGGQVHYEAIAARVKVSKWTAYDMMQELMADGLVRSSYSTAFSGFRGRSQVLFEPTSAGLKALHDVGTPDTPPSDYGWRETALSILERAKAALKSGSDSRDLLVDLEDQSPLSFCVAMLAVLIVEFRRRGLSLAVLEALLEAGIEAGNMLSLLIGILTGELLVKGAPRMVSNLDQRLWRFAEEISKMGDYAKGLLADFARTVIKTGVTA